MIKGDTERKGERAAEGGGEEKMLEVSHKTANSREGHMRREDPGGGDS